MSISAIGSIVPTTTQLEVQKSTSLPIASRSAAPSLPTDTVTLSAAAQNASKAGDVDHDGDSH